MSEARLYVDEDAMTKSVVFGLRARGVDVLTASDARMINREDADHLALAASLERILYTFNVADYCALHEAWIAEGREHAGIVLATQQRYRVGEEIRRLMRCLGRVSAHDMRNRIEFLSGWA
jgi:hypothetical protein